jgi:thiamine pyrophosphate-dependent acetolactate synthase large subunit-like protein
LAQPEGLLMANGLSSMGISLPAAIAAKLNDPARDVTRGS